MLYPQSNAYRTELVCPGVWKFKADPEKTGEQERWFDGFDSAVDIAVPGSWNEQLEEIGLFNYIGSAWYSCAVALPAEFRERRICLRIGSADFRAKVWVNGKLAGEHQGGFLPFEFDVSSAMNVGSKNVITILVNNELSGETIPQGISSEDYLREGRLREETFPPARFDFFPYGGIHRPVVLYTTPRQWIESVRVDTRIRPGSVGLVQIRSTVRNADGKNIRCSIIDESGHPSLTTSIVNGEGEATLELPTCRFWSHEDPHLYLLRVELLDGSEAIDSYELPVGVREVTVSGGQLMLNGKPVYLKGFGRHEDFPVIGKALSLPLAIKDFGLLRWINANSFRTSHYPYAEEVMAMADRKGFLVIDEVPAVSLDLRTANEKTLAAHKQAIRDLIARDYNHPSVIMWALGNEPNLVGEEGYLRGSGKEYWKQVFSFARTLDTTRPMTVPNCTRAGVCDPVFEFSDILTINRYYGWYEYPGRLDRALHVLDEEIEKIHAKYNKPVMMTEFGSDTIPGLHSIGDQMFTEEYQQKLIEQYIRLLRSKSYVVGEHVWNFADFRTPQHFRRVMLNMKGVFSRTREPKAAAFALKKIWASSDHVK